MMEPPLIGIDIGWSKKRASCGVALARATRLQLPPGARRYGRSVEATKLKLRDLVSLAASWRERHPAEIDRAIVVIDGPLGAGVAPPTNRHVDLACARDGFSRRCPPTQLSSPSSRDFVAATREVLQALGLERNVVTGDPAQATLPVVLETNPTVALALSVKQQDPNTLPTRRRARLLRIAGARQRVIRAKSDWYWEIGGDAAVWKTLGMCPEVEEHDHERVAALTCLGIASACASGIVTCIGDETGMYALLPFVDTSWQRDVTRVGMLTGTPLQYGSHPELDGILDGAPVVTVAGPASSVVAQDSDDETSRGGDDVDLLLCDSGGVWESHNPWLVGCESPVKLDLTPHHAAAVVLQHGGGRSKSPDQWVISPSTEKLRDALRPALTGEPHDFDARLSLTNALSVPARITE